MSEMERYETESAAARRRLWDFYADRLERSIAGGPSDPRCDLVQEQLRAMTAQRKRETDIKVGLFLQGKSGDWPPEKVAHALDLPLGDVMDAMKRLAIYRLNIPA